MRTINFVGDKPRRVAAEYSLDHGQTFQPCASVAVEVEPSLFEVDLTAAETSGDSLVVRLVKDGKVIGDAETTVLPAEQYDELFKSRP